MTLGDAGLETEVETERRCQASAPFHCHRPPAYDRPELTELRFATDRFREANPTQSPVPIYSGSFSLRTSAVSLGSSRRLRNIWSCRTTYSEYSRMS
jgi:hypothetical protein